MKRVVRGFFECYFILLSKDECHLEMALKGLESVQLIVAQWSAGAFDVLKLLV